VYSIVTPERFLRQARAFFKRHPDLKERFSKTVSDLHKDPFAPHLKLHPLKGRLEGCHACSLTYSYRITLTIALVEKELILLDIGSHGDVYR
jgi:mRNA-degrading endonuclease YafQ of YafQ-DinJ toxin-antitoxin module